MLTVERQNVLIEVVTIANQADRSWGSRLFLAIVVVSSPLVRYVMDVCFAYTTNECLLVVVIHVKGTENPCSFIRKCLSVVHSFDLIFWIKWLLPTVPFNDLSQLASLRASTAQTSDCDAWYARRRKITNLRVWFSSWDTSRGLPSMLIRMYNTTEWEFSISCIHHSYADRL
jgi:hypothetical protein